MCEWLDGATNEVKDGHLQEAVDGGLRDALRVIKCSKDDDIFKIVKGLDSSSRAAYVLEFESVRRVDISSGENSVAFPVQYSGGAARLSCMLVSHNRGARLAVFDRRQVRGRRGVPWAVFTYERGVASAYTVSDPPVYSLLFDVERNEDVAEIYPKRPEAMMKWDPRMRENSDRLPSKSMKVDMEKDDDIEAMVSEDSEHESSEESPHGGEFD
jgi:hypothetical protein